MSSSPTDKKINKGIYHLCFWLYNNKFLMTELVFASFSTFSLQELKCSRNSLSEEEAIDCLHRVFHMLCKQLLKLAGYSLEQKVKTRQ